MHVNFGLITRDKVEIKIANCHRKYANEDRFKSRKLFFFGVVSFLWFIFRTGTKPSRVMYPCQRAALVNSSMLLNVSIPFSLTAVLTKKKRAFSGKGVVLALLVIVASVGMSSEQFWDGLQSVAAVDPDQEFQLVLEPRNASVFPASDIYAVSEDCAHMNCLVDLMSSRGLHFYKTTTNPEGLIASDDVVIIKVNAQHVDRGRTNTDLVLELVEAIVLNHPEEFTGEIVIADNNQGTWGGGLGPPMDLTNQNNAEDVTFSYEDVARMYPSFVSTFTWADIQTVVSDYHTGDMNDGYVEFATGELGDLTLNYPKFQSSLGTYISLMNGIWTGSAYEDRLKLINVPVLKTHGEYGVTAAVKHYLGVISRTLFDYHSAYVVSPWTTYITAGCTGLEMAQVNIPTLNVIDALWINPKPRSTGSHSRYGEAVYTGILLASTDPVALDYIASKYIIMPVATELGYGNLNWVDPDYDGSWTLQGSLHYMLANSMNFLNGVGHAATMNEDQMNVYVRAQFPEDTTSPTISILSPENKTYPVNDVHLTFTVSEPTSWIGYSMDGQSNETIAGNTTLTGLLDGSHYVIVCANDTAGNMGESSTVYFTIDTTLPNIRDVSQTPLENNVLPEDEVRVNATVTDALSGVKQVTLNYTYTNSSGTWQRFVNMTNLEGNVWNTTIPAFPYCTNVTYVITAENNVGNIITTEEMRYELQYHVIPEFPSFIIMLLFMITTMLAVIAYRRKPSVRAHVKLL